MVLSENNLLEIINTENGINKVLEIYKKNLGEYCDDICKYAVIHGHLKVLQWARNQNPPYYWNTYTCAYAALHNRFKILKWLRSQDPPCPWDKDTCAYAAMNGNLKLLKWLRNQNPICPWDKFACRYAIENGHLKVLQWLISQDPPWDEWICTCAFEKGNLNMLKLLLVNNYWCKKDTINEIDKKYPTLIKEIIERDGYKCSFKSWVETKYDNAFDNNDLETFKWLLINNCPCYCLPWNIIFLNMQYPTLIEEVMEKGGYNEVFNALHQGYFFNL
jgi:hypothetical protein